MQFGLVAVGYAAVLAFAAASLYTRHLLAIQDPVTASGGMFAAGDTMLQLFLGFLLLIPTGFLIRIIAKSETLYTSYSRILFGENYVAQSLSWLCFFRILQSPVILVAMGISRSAARFDRAKKLASYALLIEGLTLGLPLAFSVAVFIRR